MNSKFQLWACCVFFSEMLANALPLPLITGTNSHHTLTWSRQPNILLTLRIYRLNYVWSLYSTYLQFQPGLSKTSICLFDLSDFLEREPQTDTYTSSLSYSVNMQADLWRCGQCRCVECVLSVVTSSNFSHRYRDNYQVCALQGFLCGPISNYALQVKLWSVFYNSCCACKV